MIARMPVADGSALPSPRVMVTRLLVRLLVHRSSVTGLPLVRLLVCLFVHLSCISPASLVRLLVHRWSCRSFAAALLESWALVRLIIRYSSV